MTYKPVVDAVTHKPAMDKPVTNKRASVSPPQKEPAMPGRAGPNSPRGFVLLIVMIIGIAAGLGAAALISTSGGARLAALHSHDGDAAAGIAEAGMERAVAYLQSVAGNSLDFDGVLDRGLNSVCDPINPQADDFTPNWSDSAVVTYQGKAYSRVNMDTDGDSVADAAYLVRFDDDDDDQPYQIDWIRVTGNNPANNCNEGPHNDQAVNGANYGNGANNYLRDRNRTIFVTVVGLYPLGDGATADTAKHRVVMRRLHSAPRFPGMPGIQVKGNITVSGSGSIAACSPIGSLEVDGDASGGAGKLACACGFSEANNFITSSGWDHCTEETHVISDPCNSTVTVGTVTYEIPGCAPGQLNEPGPSIPDLPDLDNDPDAYIDFERPCVFWVDVTKHQLWFWDANRDAAGQTCGERMEGSGLGKSAILPPDPSKASAPSAASSDLRGCWTPLVLDMNTSASAGGNPPAIPNHPSQQCYFTPFHDGLWDGSAAAALRADGRTGFQQEGSSGQYRCGWAPRGGPNTDGKYRTCNDVALSGFGCDVGLPGFDGPSGVITMSLGSGLGPLNQKLQNLSEPLFPHNVALNKPDWSQCTVVYPPDGTVIAQKTYHCLDTEGDGVADTQGCTATNGATLGTSGVAIHHSHSGGHPWFRGRNSRDVDAVPAGVYWFSADIAPTGTNFGNWDVNAHPIVRSNDANDVPLEYYMKATIVTSGTFSIQQPGYVLGPGQTDEGGDNPKYRLSSVIAKGGVTFKGAGNQAVAGTVYTTGNADWAGSGTMMLFGELHTKGNFTIGGSGKFWWLYQVPFQDPPIGTTGTPPTQFRSAH